MGHFPDNILLALKETVLKVFWKKEDVKNLLQRCEVPSSLLSQQDWQKYKYHIVSPVLDWLNSNDDGLGPLRRILLETLQYKDGNHLLWMSDGQKKKREAEAALEHLRLLVKDHDATVKAGDEQKQVRMRQAEEAKRGAHFQSKLTEIKDQFIACCQSQTAQARGYSLEQILCDLFLLFELDPRGPFRRTGEQIDGAFTHDNDPFLLEAKWQRNPVVLADLRDLDGAVGSSLDNTLGLFLSLNGFSQQALDGYIQGNRPKIICMDGGDLMAILEKRVDFGDLLRRKREIAAQGRLIFVPFSEILKGVT